MKEFVKPVSGDFVPAEEDAAFRQWLLWRSLPDARFPSDRKSARMAPLLEKRSNLASTLMW
jgi:hypothetical protein